MIRVLRTSRRQHTPHAIRRTPPLLLWTLLLLLALALPARAAERPVIAILPFANLKDAPALNWLGVTGDLLSSRLRAVRELILIDPDEAQRVARELDGTTGLSLDVDAARKLGRMLGAERLLTGGFEQTGSQIRLVARWLDPATGEFSSPLEVNGPAREALKLPGRLAMKLLEQMRVHLATREAQWLTSQAAAGTAVLEQFRRGLAAYWHERPADNESAIASFRRAADADPAFAPAWAALGGAYYQKYIQGWDSERTWLERAVEAGRKALALNPLLLEGHLVVGRSLTALGQLSAARQSFQQAASVNPNDPAVYQGMAEVSIREGLLDEAVVLYQKALSWRPRAAEIRVALGQTLFKQSRWRDAAEQFTQALALRPRWGMVYSALGDCQLRLQNGDAAQESFQKALSITPRDWTAHYGLGRVHAAAGRWEKAMAAYEKGLAFNPTYPYLYTGLGDAYFQLHQPDKAIGAYQKALALRPDDVGINYNLAALHALEKRTLEALRYLEKAISLDAGAAEWASKDKDFDNIRRDARFMQLVKPQDRP